MKEQLERLQVIAKEIEEIIAYSMRIRNEDIPKGLQSKDEAAIPLMEEEKNAYSMFDDVMEILDGREDMEATKQKIDNFSEKLAALSFKPEIKKGSFKFFVDDNSYEVVVERRYLIYFYIHSPESSTPYFMGTAFHFSMLVRLLEFFHDRLKASNQSNKYFEKIMEDVIETADKFRPEWRELHEKPLVKSQTMDDMYFTKRDTEKMKTEFQAMSAGIDYDSLKDKENIDELFSELMSSLRTQSVEEASSANIFSRKSKELEISEIVDKFVSVPQSFSAIFVNNIVFHDYAEGILKKYTVRNKLNQLRLEINSIKNELEEFAPMDRKIVNKFPLIKDSLINEIEEDFLLLLKEMTTDDKVRLIDFLKEQDDAFFKKRNGMFFNAILNGDLLLDDELIHRVLPLAFSDPSFIIEGFSALGLSKEKIEEEVRKQTPDLFKRLSNESVTPEVKETAARIGEEIADRLFEKTKEQLSKLFDEYPDEELPEQIAKLVNPHFLEEIQELGQYNE